MNCLFKLNSSSLNIQFDQFRKSTCSLFKLLGCTKLWNKNISFYDSKWSSFLSTWFQILRWVLPRKVISWFIICNCSNKNYKKIIDTVVKKMNRFLNVKILNKQTFQFQQYILSLELKIMLESHTNFQLNKNTWAIHSFLFGQLSKSNSKGWSCFFL